MAGNKYIKELERIRKHNKAPYTFLQCNKLQNLVTPFKDGTYSVVGGAPGVGLTSFMNETIVNNLLELQRNDFEYPLNIHYFCLGSTELDAVLKLSSVYIAKVYGLVVTPSDMRGDKTKQSKIFEFDLETLDPATRSKVETAINSISEAISWVTTNIENGSLHIYAGNYNPTTIFNKMTSVYTELGTYKEATDMYTVHEKYADNQVLVVIDNIKELQPDLLGHGLITDKELHSLMNEKIKKLTRTYHSSVLVSVPTEIKFARSYKDTEPVGKHLGLYGISCDTGIVLYDPIVEKHKDLSPSGTVDSMVTGVSEGGDPYKDARGSNVLRYWFLVRNTSGPSNINQKLIYLPGAGVSTEVGKEFIPSTFEEVKSEIINNIAY